MVLHTPLCLCVPLPIFSQDLKDGFHHVDLQQSHQKYVGFQLGDQYYQYTVLPFGSQSSPYVFTRMLKPALQELRSQGVRLVAYVDDLLIMASSKEQLNQHVDMAIKLLTELGWQLNWAKSSVLRIF